MNCKNCQKELTKKQTTFCSIVCKSEFQSKQPKEIFDKKKEFKCKVDGKTFSSGGLRSGALRKYSTNVLNKEFDINDWELADKPINIDEYWNCPYCDWKGKSKNGLDGGGWIGNHLQNVHNLTKDAHVEQFPDDCKLWPCKLKQIDRIKKIYESEDNRIQCLECGEWLISITNSHLNTHDGMTKNEYKQKYNVQMLSSNEYRKRLSKQYYQNTNLLNSNSWRSKYEQEICDLLTYLNIDFISNHKKFGFDIDIFIHSHNLAIEFNGLYWHSEYAGGKTEFYHLNKTKECEKLGIHLIHIFEDEWRNQQNIVVSRLKNLLGKTENIVYARKCEIREVNYQYASNFLKNNHLQGSITTIKVRLGLFNQNELVSLMTFGLPRNATGNKIKQEGQWELQRFCNKLNFNVVGGASKLLKYFEETFTPKKIFSFADRRWTSTLKDSLYDELGFSLTSKGSPNYWYLVEDNKRHHRFNFTKHNILKLFPKAKSELSEWNNMIELGFDRIWDCGSLKYEKTFESNLLISDISEPIEMSGTKPVKRRRKRKETTRNIQDVKCEICQNLYSIVGIATHFKLNHGMSVDEYVKIYGEYRPTRLKELEIQNRSIGNFNCKICGFECRGEKHLSSHVLNVHSLKKLEYVKSIIFDNQIPKCKCGCDKEVGLLSYQPYFREYLSGHNSKGENNPMFGKEHKLESKIKMSGPRTKRK